MVKGAKVYTFSQLARKIGESRGGEAKLATNTTAHFLSSTKIGIKLHWTDVVIVGADGTYTLNTGGYTTKTTMDRLNGFSPAKIIQKDFAFYVMKNPSGGKGKDNLIPFYDGIKVSVGGRVI
jgi:hypothetical protein